MPVAKLFTFEKGYAKGEVTSVAHENAPALHVIYCPAVHPPKPLAKKREVEAVEKLAYVEVA